MMRGFGALGFGEAPLDGEAVDLAVLSTGPESLASWTHSRAGGMTPRFAVAVDGDVIGITSDTSLALPILDAGTHRLTVVPLRSNVRRPPELHGELYGARAFLRWAPSPSSDCVGYQVFWDGGLGAGVNYGSPIATVERVEIHARYFAGPSFGFGGTGTLSFWGGWSGTQTINEAVTVQVTADGLTCDLATGDIAFGEDDILPLGFGLLCRVDSPADEYVEGDSYQVWVGPRCEWQSDQLAQGDHVFGICAVDLAGNLSDPIEQAVRIIGRARDMTGAAATWDGTDITFSWDLPGLGDGSLGPQLELFANYSPTFGALQDTINLDGAFATAAEDWVEESVLHRWVAELTEYTFTPPVTGVWRFYLRASGAYGWGDNQSIEMLEVDTTGHPTGVALNEPDGIEAIPLPDGLVRIFWRYELAGGEDLAAFAIYGDGAGEVKDPGDRELVAPVIGGAPVIVGTLDVDPADFSGASHWLVTAIDTTDFAAGTHESPNDDWVICSGDATPPTLAEPLTGVPN